MSANISKRYLKGLREAQQFGLLYEAILQKDPDLGESALGLYKNKAENSPFFQRVLQHGFREGIYSDMAGALGSVYNMVVNAAAPNTIGRDMLTVVEADKPVIRYPRAKNVAVAQRMSEKSPLMLGENYDYVDIDCTPEIATGQKWTQSFVEDAEWQVLERQMEAIGKALAYTETLDVIALYNAITAGNLATGAEITISSPITWLEFLSLLKAVDDENFVPRVIAVSPTIFYEMLNIEQFTNMMYITSARELKRNEARMATPSGEVILIKSSMVTKTLVLDTEVSAAMGIRREAMIKPWEDPGKMEYGVVGSERYGLGLLRTKAIARGSR